MENFKKLAEIMATLRGPGGCPWDQEQTHKDINPYLIEEAYEVLESIDKEDFDGLKEELGDLLVHIFFHCQLTDEKNRFNANDVAKSACEKLIRRHPHVYGDKKAATTDEVLKNWEKIKQQEGKGKKKESILEGLPKSLPATVKAFRIGEKTSRVGFDWSDKKGILEKVKEELDEFQSAIASKDSKATEEEYGDLLFTLANVGRFLKVDPETALRKASDKFIQRFQSIEKECKANNRSLQDLSAKEWNELWEKAKKAV